MKLEHYEATQKVLEYINTYIPHYEVVWQRDFGGDDIRTVVGPPESILNNDYGYIEDLHDRGYYMSKFEVRELVSGVTNYQLWICDVREALNIRPATLLEYLQGYGK